MIGIFLRYTDILPILGGFILGFTIHKTLIQGVDECPTILATWYSDLINRFTQTLNDHS
jgi:hypothetical protein